MSDPFSPDWSKAPEAVEWHTVDANNMGLWWELCPSVGWYMTEGQDDTEEDWISNMDYHDDGQEEDLIDEESETEDEYEIRQQAWRERGELDWRNSLRHRPEVK